VLDEPTATRLPRRPTAFVVTASSGEAPVAVMEDGQRRLYAVQFHPEVMHTNTVRGLLESFLHKEAQIPATWDQ